jgi:amino acid adenylation domain-containing protein
MRSFVCDFIGGGPLLAQCLKFAVGSGHRIAALYSDSTSLIAWARQQGIDVHAVVDVHTRAPTPDHDAVFMVGDDLPTAAVVARRAGCRVIEVKLGAKAATEPATVAWFQSLGRADDRARCLWTATAEPERAAEIAFNGFVEVLAMLARGADVDAIDLKRPQLDLHTLMAPAEPADGGSLLDMLAKVFERAAAIDAIVCNNRSLNYAELDRQSDVLAHALRRRRNGSALPADTPVGLHVRRGPGVVVGMLGILKAGGAFVPLDDKLPAERLRYMVEDCQARLVVTDDPAMTGSVLMLGDDSLIALDDLDTADGAAADTASLSPISRQADDLTYVIYTSGSTGRPKGVAIADRSVCNLAESFRAFLPITPGDRVLQFASISFDASIVEIFSSLAAGATLYIAADDERLSTERLAGFLAEHEITVSILMSSVLGQLPQVSLPALRSLVVAGETCSIETVRFWSRDRRLINGYGPTEATVCASMWLYGEGDPPNRIGRALPNVGLHVLAPDGSAVPPGEAGELHISGVGLARGYIGQPELTAERFFPNPQGSERLYRTGDMVRWAEPSVLDFLGRADNQVKIAGVRVELDEVAAVLDAVPGVDQSAVVLVDNNGLKSLVAFYVPVGEPLAEPQLVARLSASLQSVMIPSRFIALDALPLNMSDKIDRVELARRAERTAVGEPPATPIENEIATMWRDALGLAFVGRRDNFYALGGDSLRTTRLVQQINHRFGTRLVPAKFRSLETLADLARYIDGSSAVSKQSEAREAEDF